MALPLLLCLLVLLLRLLLLLLNHGRHILHVEAVVVAHACARNIHITRRAGLDQVCELFILWVARIQRRRHTPVSLDHAHANAMRRFAPAILLNFPSPMQVKFVNHVRLRQHSCVGTLAAGVAPWLDADGPVPMIRHLHVDVTTHVTESIVVQPLAATEASPAKLVAVLEQVVPNLIAVCMQQ